MLAYPGHRFQQHQLGLIRNYDEWQQREKLQPAMQHYFTSTQCRTFGRGLVNMYQLPVWLVMLMACFQRREIQ